MLKFKSIFWFSFIFVAVSWGAHPFYLSVTDLRYNAREKALQGTIKMFTNDLEDALNRPGKKKFDLLNYTDTVLLKKELQSYVDKRLSVIVDNQAQKLEVIGFENEEEATWLYVESRNCSIPRQVNIENALLYDFIAQQMNIVHFQVNSDQKSAKVTAPEKRMVFEF